MCRALWVLLICASDDSCKRLRRAAGAEAQIVGLTTHTEEAVELAATTNADVIVIDGDIDAAEQVGSRVRERAPDAAIVWVGERAPDGSGASVTWSDDLEETLPGAMTKALLSRRRRG